MSDQHEQAEDGSHWVDLARGVIQQEREIPALTQRQIRNALTAEIITAIPSLAGRTDLLSIGFGKGKNGLPAMRIQLLDATQDGLKSIDAERNAFTDWVAKKTEHCGNTFSPLQGNGSVTIENRGGYYGRNDTTITAKTVDDLVAAAASLVSNPIIRDHLLNGGKKVERQ